MSEPFVLDASFSAFRAESFANDVTGRLVQNAVTGTGADTVSLDRTVVNGIDETTSERLDSWKVTDQKLSLIHISEPTRRLSRSRMPSSA